MKKNVKIILILFIVGFLVFFAVVMFKKPSHNRNWEVGQEKLPKINIVGNDIEISNFRDFIWNKDGSVDNSYVTKKYELNELEKVDVIISHFSDFEGLAHIFLSFGFKNEENVVISMETRREMGEEFSPTRGLIREFEIIYVAGSERDIVGLRTNVRGERVYVYPTVAGPEKSRELFVKISEDINGIYAKPKFYNTLSDNCTNVITRRVEEISKLKFPLTYKSIMPGYFDEVLYEMEIIPNPSGKSFAEIKNCYFIDNGEVDYAKKEFSSQLRKTCNSNK